MSQNIKTLLDENRIFKPSKELIENSNVKKWMDKQNIKDYEDLLKKAEDIEWYWNAISKEFIDWYSPYNKVLEWNPPHAKWFIDGKCNIAHNALDRHIATEKKNKIAYIWEGEPGEVRKLTYNDLYIEVNKLSNALKSMGIKKGDRIMIYLPMIPELPISMLACAKIGAIHSVVFSGFSSLALRDRINDSEAKILITCDGFYRRGKTIPLKKQSDEALKDAQSIENVIVFKRTGEEVPWNANIDNWWHAVTEKESDFCETEIMDSEDRLFILYTSGTTGKPKGIEHVHGGYSVGIANTLSFVFDLKDDDVYWCAADIGWITGHSYIVYAPLILGVTSVMYEGSPDYPKIDRLWEMVEKYKVSVFYTSPTAIRMFMKFGESHIKKHNLDSIRLLGSVGEPINPEAWIWYHKHIGNENCQIMDTWWQTETGCFVISPLPITPLKPGSATKPLPGFIADVYDEKGNSLSDGSGGYLVMNKPWPSMLRGVYKNPKRFFETYWEMFENTYMVGDLARKDEDGYFWIQGRTDDVLSIAGHRIGNSEVESALVSHPNVAEAAVVGKPHEVKGESITAFVVLNEGMEPNGTLRSEIREFVSKEIGKIARPDEVLFVNDVPKTRSGKIMRRVILAKVTGNPIGDISTLANPESVDGLDNAI